MSNAQSLLRSLVIYAICIPLAVFLGYQLPSFFQDQLSFITVTAVLAMLCAPLLLRFHHLLMVLSWNLMAILFFLPGRPQVWLAAIALSFAISLLQRILNKEMPTIHVPALTWPLIVMGLVVLGTAMLTGGIGVQALGGSVYGGRRYFYIALGIIGYFALVLQRIPRERAMLYMGLYFLGSVSGLIGDLVPLLGTKLPQIYLVFPPSEMYYEGSSWGVTRLGGCAVASWGIFAFMLAKYGVRGIFLDGKPWRLLAFLFFSGIGLLGGFRSSLIQFILVFTLLFFLEGMHRTRLFPTLLLAGTLAGSVIVPFAQHLPPAVQRSMAFLPMPIDPVVRQDAEGSSEWRLSMWKAMLPKVPQYLWLGKGLGFTPEDMSFAVSQATLHPLSEDEWGSALAGDYHNGPLSVIIPFGIWGMIVWIWFQVAGLRVLYRNYRYGDPSLRTINTFLLASYIGRSLLFWLIFGGFYGDLVQYTGLLGLSVSLNGGVAKTAPAPVKAGVPSERFTGVLPQPRPAFGR
jgi:hypothetical protein